MGWLRDRLPLRWRKHLEAKEEAERAAARKAVYAHLRMVELRFVRSLRRSPHRAAETWRRWFLRRRVRALDPVSVYGLEI